MRTSSLYQSLSSLRKSATVGECVRRDSIVRGRVVFGMFGADMLLSCDESAWYTVAAGGKSSGDCVVRPGRKLHVAFIL